MNLELLAESSRESWMPDHRRIQLAILAGFNVCTRPRYSLLVHPTSAADRTDSVLYVYIKTPFHPSSVYPISALHLSVLTPRPHISVILCLRDPTSLLTHP